MVALAVREILPEAQALYIQVNGAPVSALIKHPICKKYRTKLHPDYPEFIHMRLPDIAYRNMMKFDALAANVWEEKSDNSVIIEARKTIQPFEFPLFVPHILIDMIGISQVYKVLSESKTLQLKMS